MAGLQDVTAVTTAAALLFGLLLPLLGSLKAPLAKRLDLGETRLRSLRAAFGLTLIPMMLLAGLLADAVGVRAVLFAGSLVAAAGLFGLAMSRSYVNALTATVVAGVGGACLNTAAVLLMPGAYFLGHPVAALNLGHVFVGLGALLTPFVVESLLGRLGFRHGLGVLAILVLAPAFLAGITAEVAFKPAGMELDPRYAEVFRSPLLWLAALVLLFYRPLEVVLSGWARRYLMDVGLPEGRAAVAAGGFWVMFLAGRFGAALWQRADTPGWVSQPWFPVLLALAAAVFLGNLAGAHKARLATWGFLGVGVLLGPIFPTMVGNLFECFEVGQYGTAYGAMYFLGAGGGVFLPAVMDAYARRRTVRRAMILHMIGALLLAVAALVFGLARSQLGIT
jgi:fucose permease